jgi:hypothetical protein
MAYADVGQTERTAASSTTYASSPLGLQTLAEARKRGLVFKGNQKVLGRVIGAQDFQK